MQPAREQIARRAYEIWLEEGCPIGCAESHWLRAEADVLQSAPR